MKARDILLIIEPESNVHSHNTWWKCLQVCVCACSGTSVCPFIKAVKHSKLWENKIEAQEKWMKFSFSCLIFVSFCSSSLIENRNSGIEFSLQDFCETWGLVSSPCEKEVARLPQQLMRFWRSMLQMYCFKQTRRAGMLRSWFDFVSPADVVNLAEENSSLCKLFPISTCWSLSLKWCYY